MLRCPSTAVNELVFTLRAHIIFTVNSEIKSRRHGADGVSESTRVDASAGAEDGLKEHRPVVHR